ncbi:sulfatase [Marinilabilia rubra]|uniref:Sulfatase n=1 Tax=Marinilabilia rubra TaxID=2162893 RepID=A0A2U2BEM8_9BACT|nr:sulfatase [Marinilabilia rubra]PWE01477.1 sulfatase [Marinilabilia rubra]
MVKKQSIFIYGKAALVVLTVLISGIAGCQTPQSETKTGESTQPNVVLFYVDDLGWKDLSSYGSEFYQTPNVDKLAAEGIAFTNAYAACNVCSPSRASLMTGKYPARINVTDWITGWKFPYAKLNVPDWTMYLDTAHYTLAEAFRDEGYTTAHIGKWHLGEEEVFWPENQGFDINVGGWKKGSPNRNKNKGFNGYFPPFGNPRLEDKPGDNYLTDRLAQEACRFLENTGDSPFYLNLWFYSVHTPLQAEKAKIEKYKSLVDSSYYQQNPVYAAMVEHMDLAIGKVVEKLKSEDLFENTIILFTSDNGGLLGNKKRSVTNNYPLREGKGHSYEGGVRVPFIVYAPSLDEKNKKCDVPVITPDIYPTLLDLCNIPIRKDLTGEIDGKSLRTLLHNPEGSFSREAVYWHYPHYHIQGATPHSAIRKGDYKLIHFYENDSFELYNLIEDIGETNNVIDEEVSIAAQMKMDLEEWIENVDAQMPTVNNEYNPQKRNKH